MFGPIGPGDGALFDEGGLLDALLVGLLPVGAGALRGGDLVDREQAEIAEQALVVDTAERAVVDDPLEARSIGGDPAVDNCSIAARLGSRKWAPRFDYAMVQESFPALDAQQSETGPSASFENHRIHGVLDTVGQMRPSVDIFVAS